MALPTASELIFSEQANHNFSKTLGEIKRHTLSIHNRLQSILSDAAFVESVKDVYQRPLVANERCGSWYLQPEQKAGSAYFKSTDGHTGVWYFSTRRLNLHLLQLIGENDGCIIIDSTRRGKRMPDALSKTIPIWCCVLNRALFPEQIELHDLYTPPNAVSSSEHSQILLRIDRHVESFFALQPNLSSLRKTVTKALRPVWVTPESDLDSDFSGFEQFHPIICCTSSRRVAGTEASEGGYIQGSGDDTENWAHGLTPPVFWSNADLLLSTPESELPELIAHLVTKSEQAFTCAKLTLIVPTQNLYIGTLADLEQLSDNDNAILIKLLPTLSEPLSWQSTATSINLNIGAHKLGSRELRTALPIIISFVKQHLTKEAAETATGKPAEPAIRPDKIVVACTTGKDHSAGVVLALLCLLYVDSGAFMGDSITNDAPVSSIDKLFIRRRLGWIMAALSDANPSRATLQSVNSFLMDKPR